MTQVSEEKKPDVVEVTRCLHCWQSMEIRQKYNGQNCRYCFMLDCPVTEDFFCAKGKTREQGEAYDMMAGLWNRRTGVNDGEQNEDHECDNAGCDEG